MPLWETECVVFPRKNLGLLWLDDKQQLNEWIGTTDDLPRILTWRCQDTPHTLEIGSWVNLHPSVGQCGLRNLSRDWVWFWKNRACQQDKTSRSFYVLASTQRLPFQQAERVRLMCGEHSFLDLPFSSWVGGVGDGDGRGRLPYHQRPRVGKPSLLLCQ